MELRTVEKLYSDGWRYIPFSALEDGDRFRLFDDEETVVGDEGNTEFVATGDAYLNQNEEYQINIE